MFVYFVILVYSFFFDGSPIVRGREQGHATTQNASPLCPGTSRTGLGSPEAAPRALKVSNESLQPSAQSRHLGAPQKPCPQIRYRTGLPIQLTAYVVQGLQVLQYMHPAVIGRVALYLRKGNGRCLVSAMVSPRM